MKILDLVFEVDRVRDTANYDKNYEFWSFDKSGTYLLMNVKRDSQFFTNPESIICDSVSYFYHSIYDSLDAPFYVAPEEIERFERFEIEFEGAIPYEFERKYPVIFVRGGCSGKCSPSAEAVHLSCFHKIPCLNNRPDYNGWSSKYPEFYEVLRGMVQWMELCPDLNAFVVLLEYEPMPPLGELVFDSSYGVLIRGSKIRVIGKSDKIRALYKEYNQKYPTADREFEEWVSEPEEGFYFRF